MTYSDSFTQAFNFTIGAEGGYVNNPDDPGGETKYGISKRSYPNEDIANLALDRAKEIYHSDYWNRIRGDDLPPAVAMVTFDAAVNSGPHMAVVWLQDAAGADMDGVIGPLTIRAVQRKLYPETLIADMLRLRLAFMQTLPNWTINRVGWPRRLFRLAMEVGKVI